METWNHNKIMNIKLYIYSTSILDEFSPFRHCNFNVCTGNYPFGHSHFWKTEARAIITIPNRLLTKYLMCKLHIVPIFVISGYFFLLSYLKCLKKNHQIVILEIHAGNSSPFWIVMLHSKRYLMLLLYSPYYYTQSYIFGSHFCQFGHLWMIISAVYRDFHEKKIEFSSSSSSALPFAIDIFSTIKQKISQKKYWTMKLVHCLNWSIIICDIGRIILDILIVSYNFSISLNFDNKPWKVPSISYIYNDLKSWI